MAWDTNFLYITKTINKTTGNPNQYAVKRVQINTILLQKLYKYSAQ
jgi:hypothetical protein